VVIHFVDIGGIVDHHCLNFFFINNCNFILRENFFFHLCPPPIKMTDTIYRVSSGNKHQ
jgi:hypothetical protein